DFKPGPRKVDGFGAPVPRATTAVVTELCPQPPAAVHRACCWTSAEGPRNAPPIAGNTAVRGENHWAPPRVRGRSLRPKRRGFRAVDTRCAVPFPVGRQPAHGGGGDSPANCRVEPS